MHYFFELGRHHLLSRAEIEHVFLARNIPYTIVATEDAALIVDIPHPIDSVAIMHMLGGTIKIARSIMPQVTDGGVSSYLAENQLDGKIQFSLSPRHAKKLALAVKKELKAVGRSVRYIEPKNTATILHNNLVEKATDLTVFHKELFVTEAIQPIEELGKRDFDRPGRDSKSGMLPPKLAKIMINLAIETNKPDVAILDPFCGSGTVLMEALMMGYTNLTGSDSSDKAVTDTKNNLSWLSEQYPDIPTVLSQSVTVIEEDVRSIDTALPPASIDSIVTEPYMGRPVRASDSEIALEKQAKELGELYKYAFSVFKKILRPGGTVVMVIPKFKYKESWITIDCIPSIERSGFEVIPICTQSSSLLYYREDQFVAREIWKFKKTRE
ncbi:MAG: hypothetical protein COU33_03405 [Candidatus Magasanikbacteria bacterium CG10_big_fil_rev_8_21_14_0_10_43_6]|uniref:Ribosomal RNA large subunit methyltransferase K/L-like methyltransferase domain-containing protein n=1 Tax=Candidatus Magasanikbacteria bacterium CG10_big_fil_rev_8_21_14_0_10_43_6 TaxID=1974650 RepID=A0A2M6W0V0_9BACT|nr:MAG: hypothetical protein COU33_03405 [Candidatus Magasanikbacteria bacterium CG10_big_fil_rev_8_21_14_0_10_43_6]